MGHKDIFNIFSTMFPTFTNNIKVWFPNGKNSIRVRYISSPDCVFTYDNNKNWKLETVNSFAKKFEREK